MPDTVVLEAAMLDVKPTLGDHTVGFRQSVQYQQWRALLHHFYDSFPSLEHFVEVLQPSHHTETP